MAKQHAGTSVSHDVTSLGSSRRFIAVYGTVRAGRFVVAIRTFSQPALCIVEKLNAACAQIARGRFACGRFMMVGAVNSDHLRHRHTLAGKVLLLRLHSDPDSGVRAQFNK
jgi:hypothetical protein